MKELKTILIDNLCYLEVSKLRPKTAPSIGYVSSGTVSIASPHHKIDIRFKLKLSKAGKGIIKLSYRNPIDSNDMEYNIALETIPANFGGHRVWFICPATGARAAKLYLNPHDGIFVSQKCLKDLRVLYYSQLYGDYDRALAMRQKYQRKATCSTNTKPKGMHFTTYQKLVRKYQHYSKKCHSITLVEMGALNSQYTS
jgi:hypothetical protein